MTPLTKWTVVAVCLTVLAVLVPWARYGDVDVELSRLPWWWAYLGAAVLTHGSALVPARAAAPVSGLFALVTVAAAVVVATGYDHAAVLFDHVVPTVGPRPGLGVAFAVASVVAQVVGLRAGARAARPVHA
ncbi:hypothetical protein [Saccharothrix hoggarensis]|uniref:Uncharacterized protein n=1 Tax=Saccharothrix hoggarensis TaxID=913853 RepID=A0ABW3R2T0_9PSEU